MTAPKFEFLTPIAVQMLSDNPAPLERDPDDIGSGPLFPETPEQALLVALDDDESFDE